MSIQAAAFELRRKAGRAVRRGRDPRTPIGQPRSPPRPPTEGGWSGSLRARRSGQGHERGSALSCAGYRPHGSFCWSSYPLCSHSKLLSVARAKDAHDTLVATAHRAQARALEIESQAKMRLADKYDAAQERGEVQKPGGDRKTLISSRNNGPMVADIGPTAQQVHDARQKRCA